MTKNCEKVLPLKQFGPTCWFNALLTSILYSEHSRNLLLKKSVNWNKKIKVLQTIKYILENKFLKTNDINNDYLYFDKVKPEYILGLLHKYNKKKFNLTEKQKDGYLPVLYIRKLYKLFGASLLLLDLNHEDNKLYYSKYNNYFTYKKNGVKYIRYVQKPLKNIIDKYSNNKTPDVLIINDGPEYSKNVRSLDMKVLLSQSDIDDIQKLNNSIQLNGEEYVLDSVVLTNWNFRQSKLGHAISGITCNKQRYIYNGWTRQTIDPAIVNSNDKLDIPCELMKFDWDLHTEEDFCLNPKTCMPDNITDFMIQSKKVHLNNVCFSFNKGDRILIYIKKSKDPNIITNDNKCQINKVRNPLTNRCKNLSDINEKPKSNQSVFLKQCAEGKILNPKTNRCIKIPKNAKKDEVSTNTNKTKQCPEGKILNPKTNRCIKIPKKDEVSTNTNKTKQCPEGKILNPKTNRCIKIPKNAKKDEVSTNTNKTKECPEGKILNPKTNRCIKIPKNSKQNDNQITNIIKPSSKRLIKLDWITFQNKEKAKEYGARWNGTKKYWYIYDNNPNYAKIKELM